MQLLDQKESASAAERNWKEFKWIRGKLRGSMSVEKTVKLMSIHTDFLIARRDLIESEMEFAKFTTEDEICKLDLGLEAAHATRVYHLIKLG
jgi:hypothetical protein